MDNIDAQVDMAESALFAYIESAYNSYGPGIMNLVMMSIIPGVCQAVLLHYPDPEQHEVIREAIIDQLTLALETIAEQKPLTEAEIEALAATVPDPVQH